MKTAIKFILFLSLICHVAFARTSVSIAEYPSLTVSFDGKASVYNTPVNKLDKNDPFYQDQTSSAVKVLDIVLDSGSGDTYTVLFRLGEGGYVRYEFYRNGAYEAPSFVLDCDHLDFLGDGYLITLGAMNQMFPISKKFKISNGRVREVKQPYYAVNIKSKATRDIDIYANKSMKRVIAHIKKGDDVTVLLTEFKKKHVYYLLRSDQGLTGWIRVEWETWVNETPIENLYFHGD